jgi:phosphohistidine phosphatase SixA
VVTVLAVRHADIDLPPGSDDPGLNAAGHARAQALLHVVRSSGVSAVFHSEFARTQQTVAPVALALGLGPRLTPSAPAFAKAALSGDLGLVVLVAGHSDTIPAILAALGATPAPVIGEREFDNLFVLTTRSHAGAHHLHLRYGSG